MDIGNTEEQKTSSCIEKCNTVKWDKQRKNENTQKSILILSVHLNNLTVDTNLPQ